MNVDALDFFGALVSILWIALALAVGVVVLAVVWVASRIVSRRLEGRYLPRLARWSRRRAGLGEEAGPWACLVCSSVNPPTVVACYGCGVPRPSDAPELREAATDPGVFHRPPPANEFDPSRYRGPGALPPKPPEPGAAAEPTAPP
ncbi:MAG: hypothetical protein ABIG85_07215, partial [Chloroflexota bacterium]